MIDDIIESSPDCPVGPRPSCPQVQSSRHDMYKFRNRSIGSEARTHVVVTLMKTFVCDFFRFNASVIDGPAIACIHDALLLAACTSF